jgi:hypothetical protein
MPWEEMLKRLIALFTFFALPCLSALDGRVAQKFQQDAAVLRTALHAQYQVEGGYVLLSSTTVARRETDDMEAL